MKRVLFLFAVIGIVLGILPSVVVAQEEGNVIPDDIWYDEKYYFVSAGSTGWENNRVISRLSVELEYELETCNVSGLLMELPHDEQWAGYAEEADYIMYRLTDTELGFTPSGSWWDTSIEETVELASWDELIPDLTNRGYSLHQAGPGLEFAAYNDVGYIGRGTLPSTVNVDPLVCIKQPPPVFDLTPEQFQPQFVIDYNGNRVTVEIGRELSRQEIAGYRQTVNIIGPQGFAPFNLSNFEYFTYTGHMNSVYSVEVDSFIYWEEVNGEQTERELELNELIYANHLYHVIREDANGDITESWLLVTIPNLNSLIFWSPNSGGLLTFWLPRPE